MSVIVKGMEMPAECADCWFHRYSAEYDHEYCCVSAVTNFKKGDARHKGCPLVKAPEWISVEERLPEERKWVLCQCRAKIQMVLRLQDGYWHQANQHEFMRCFVTHWIPLPEPPKEDKP